MRDLHAALHGMVRHEDHPDGAWLVRTVRASDSGKVYRCPGCQQEVSAATPHVVAWPADGIGGVEDRRHWHAPCWRARSRRRPNG